MANYIEKKLSPVLEEIVEDLGYYFVDLSYKKEQGDFYLNILIDSKEGISLDDCTKISREVSDWLDEEDPINDSYYLMVSSAGLDRPLTSDRDFEIVKGKELDVALYAPLDDGRKNLNLLLDDYDKDNLYYLEDGEKKALARTSISKATKAIKI